LRGGDYRWFKAVGVPEELAGDKREQNTNTNNNDNNNTD
jgi:hypothetical protein